MFDPFQAILSSVIIEGVKAFMFFLKNNGLPVPEVDGWLAAFATAVAAILVAFGDMLVGKAPANIQTLTMFVVKFLLTFLTMIGFHDLVILPVKYVSIAIAERQLSD